MNLGRVPSQCEFLGLQTAKSISVTYIIVFKLLVPTGARLVVKFCRI